MRETALYAKVFDENPPETMKIPFCGRHDHLLEKVKELFPAATHALIIDPAFKSKDGQPFMISFDLMPSWRDRVTQQIRSFNVTALIQSDPQIGLSFAFLKITETKSR